MKPVVSGVVLLRRKREANLVRQVFPIDATRK
jgi:hypothetical protein